MHGVLKYLLVHVYTVTCMVFRKKCKLSMSQLEPKGWKLEEVSLIFDKLNARVIK